MPNLELIKDYFLKVILEESDKFQSLSEAEKEKKIADMVVLSPEKQRELCKALVEKEKDTLPGKIFMRFVGKVSNSMVALTNVSEKDKSIMSKYRDGRVEASSKTV